MEILTRILNWCRAHKGYAFALLTGLFLLPPLAVHLLFSVRGPEILRVHWSAGELLGYIASFYTLLGTGLISVIAILQNDLLAKKEQAHTKALAEKEQEQSKILADLQREQSAEIARREQEHNNRLMQMQFVTSKPHLKLDFVTLYPKKESGYAVAVDEIAVEIRNLSENTAYNIQFQRLEGIIYANNYKDCQDIYHLRSIALESLAGNSTQNTFARTAQGGAVKRLHCGSSLFFTYSYQDIYRNTYTEKAHYLLLETANKAICKIVFYSMVSTSFRLADLDRHVPLEEPASM